MKISSYTEQSPIFQMYRLNNIVQMYFARHLKKFNVNFIQSLVLLTIYFEGKSKLTPMSLVRGLGLSKSSVSQALSELEDRGWIKRKMDEEDARSISLIITPDGKSHATKIIAVFDDMEKRIDKMGKGKSGQLTDSLRMLTVELADLTVE